MELQDLSRLRRAEKLIGGIRDNLIALENSSVEDLQGSIVMVLENALQTAMNLLSDVMENMEQELSQKS